MKIMSKKSTKLFLLGAAALGAYNLYKGKGVFNKVRFKEQHQAVSDYLENHFPNSTYSEITATDEGWSCVVNTYPGNFVLYMTKTPEGVFVFWEKEI